MFLEFEWTADLGGESLVVGKMERNYFKLEIDDKSLSYKNDFE